MSLDTISIVSTERKRTAIAAVLVRAAFSLAGCGAYHNLPANWHQDLPGIYEGTSSTFRETVEFKRDGTFRHDVFEAGRSVRSESGKWSTSPGRFVVDLDHFTQFYDPMSDKFSGTGKEFVSYQLRPLPDGNTFNKISASVEFKYTLTRKKGDTP